MDGETAETLAVVVRLLQRAGQLASVRAEGEGPRSPRQLVALGIDLVAKEVRNLLSDGVDKAGPTRSGRTRSVCCDRLSSCYVRSPRPGCGGCGLVLGCGWPICWGRRTPVPGPDRRSTPPELLAANEELARLMLPEVGGERRRRCSVDFPPLDERTEDQILHSVGRDPAEERQDDNGAVAVESRPGCGVAGGVPVEGL